MKKIITVWILYITALLSGCESFLDRKPIDFPTEETFYTDVKGLEGAVIGAYDALQSNRQYGNDFMILMEKRGDNVQDDNSGASGGITYQIGVFTDTPANTYFSGSWLSIYGTIYRCNLILQSMEYVQMTDRQRVNIAGQAAFIRALSYFNLVRMWGKVPVITRIQTVEEARGNKRAEVNEVYQQIIDDLTVAKDLPATWLETERGRATSYAAKALLGKVYLYMGNFRDVVRELEPLVAAIETGTDIRLVPLPETFPNDLKTSRDILFAVQFLKGGVGESAHQNGRYRNNDNNSVITLSQEEFESDTDNRKAMVAPTGSGERPKKFNAPATNNETSSDFPVMRCAEVMLMYAEALNELSQAPTEMALNALNAVRLNAGIPAKALSEVPDKESFRKAVYQERRLELALECDRWFDIVRTGQFVTVFPGVAAYRQLYPVPQAEIENVKDATGWQNEGYIIK